MKAHRFTGRCAMHVRLLIAIAVWLTVPMAQAAEVPIPEVPEVDLSSLPAEAEAPYQDLVDFDTFPGWLDEAVFTEISPLTIPEVGIALPVDQDH